MMCSMEKVPPEKFSRFFTCQLFSSIVGRRKPRLNTEVARSERPLELCITRYALGLLHVQ